MNNEQLAMTPKGHGVAVFKRICYSAGAPKMAVVCKKKRECFSMSGGRIKTMSMSARLLAVFFLLCGICLNVAAQEVTIFPQMGHTNTVTSVAFSPDGKYVLSGSYDHTIKLWDANTGIETVTFSGHTKDVVSVSFSPDGRQILSYSWDNTIKLWNIETGKETRTFLEKIGTFTPDGRQVLSCSWDGKIKLWDVNTGSEIKSFSVHTINVTSITFSPDGRQVLLGYSDGSVKLCDLNNGEEIKRFSGHTDIINSVVFSPDGKQILSSSRDKTIKLWDANTGRIIRTFLGHIDYVNSVTFSPDGRQILSCSNDKTIRLWDVNTGRIIRTFLSYTRVSSVTFSPDGRQILSSWGPYMKLLDANTGDEIRTFFGYASWVHSISFSSDGRRIISGCGSSIKLWDVNTSREIRTFFGHTHEVSSVAFSPDERQVLSGSYDNTIKLWDINSGREIRTFFGHTNYVYSVTFSPDGRQVLSGSADNTIKLWDTNTGMVMMSFSGHTNIVTSVAFSPDGRQALSGTWDDNDTIKLWDVNTGREIKTYSGQRGVNSVTFSPDGRQILSSNISNSKLLDVGSGKEIKTFFGHTDSVETITFSPDGNQVLSGSRDGTIILWNVNSGRQIKTLLGHTNSVSSVRFSPDGRQILSGSGDGTVRLWDVDTGKEIAQFISFFDGEWLVLTPDGYYNASPNGDKYLNVRVGNNVYGIDQYRSTFYRPQVVEARLQGRPDPIRVGTDINNAASFAPPVVKILSPENGAVLSSNQVELSVSIIDEKQPIKTVKVLVNGRLVGGDSMRGIRGVRGGDLETTGIRLTDNQNKVEFRLNIALDPGKNRIEVIANNPYSEGRDSIDVTCSQPVSVKNALPNLWILSIGVNRYDDTRRLEELKFAVNDAKAIIDVFKTQEGRRYGKVNSLLIADDAAVKPTHDNIVDNFKFLRQSGPQDVILLFIAGHGVNDRDGNFYFMPSDAAFNADGSIRDSKAISSRVIQQVLNWPGQKLVFIDACSSAGTSSNLIRRVNNDRLVMDLISDPSISSSSVIFTSSKGDQASFEMDRYKHGVFTYTLLEGLKGAADLMKKGEITMTALELYIREKIPALTDGQQTPTTARPNGYDDFVVVKLNN